MTTRSSMAAAICLALAACWVLSSCRRTGERVATGDAPGRATTLANTKSVGASAGEGGLVRVEKGPSR